MRFPLTIPHDSGNRSNSCGTRPPVPTIRRWGRVPLLFWEGEVKSKTE